MSTNHCLLYSLGGIVDLHRALAVDEGSVKNMYFSQWVGYSSLSCCSSHRQKRWKVSTTAIVCAFPAVFFFKIFDFFSTFSLFYSGPLDSESAFDWLLGDSSPVPYSRILKDCMAARVRWLKTPLFAVLMEACTSADIPALVLFLHHHSGVGRQSPSQLTNHVVWAFI